MAGSRVELFAHRGSTVLAPENTALAFDAALSFGADVLEIDVRLSRDGIVVVTHDERVDRTTNGSGRVIDSRFTELQKLDAGHRFMDLDGYSYRGRGTRLMSLGELFSSYPANRINIDIKDNSLKAADAVASSIQLHGSEQRVNVGSFHAEPLLHFRQIAPDVSTAAIQREVAALYFQRLNPLARANMALPYQYLQIPTRYRGLPLATTAFIRSVRARGVKPIYWTINNVSMMRRLLKNGASGLVTDRPDLAREILGPRHREKKPAAVHKELTAHDDDQL